MGKRSYIRVYLIIYFIFSYFNFIHILVYNIPYQYTVSYIDLLPAIAPAGSTTVCLGKTKSLGPKRDIVKLKNGYAPLDEILMGIAQRCCALPIEKDMFGAFQFLSCAMPRLATEWHLPAMSSSIVVCLFCEKQHCVIL